MADVYGRWGPVTDTKQALVKVDKLTAVKSMALKKKKFFFAAQNGNTTTFDLRKCGIFWINLEII